MGEAMAGSSCKSCSLKIIAAAVAAVLAATHAAFLHAQASAEQQLPEVKVQSGREAEGYNAPTATSATKIEAPLRDIPQTVNVVPQELIRDQAARSMQDTLKNVPGVGLSSGDGQRDQVSIRGFSAISDQFIDGLRDDALYFRDLSCYMAAAPRAVSSTASRRNPASISRNSWARSEAGTSVAPSSTSPECTVAAMSPSA
jgi:outer membrane receptor for monomeric catechols